MAYKKVIRVTLRAPTDAERKVCDDALEEYKKVAYDLTAGPDPWKRAEAHAAWRKYIKAVRDAGCVCDSRTNGLQFAGVFTAEEWLRVRY